MTPSRDISEGRLRTQNSKVRAVATGSKLASFGAASGRVAYQARQSAPGSIAPYKGATQNASAKRSTSHVGIGSFAEVRTVIG